ncbi:MAG: ribonuclease Z [Lentisphaeraceae bacterium]|nr:ribonuclease Z [Lentisphaeraceae bacterium]
MKLHFLGTSAGSPTIERNVTALGLTFEQKSSWYLFDAGDGTQQQILRTSLSLPRLDKIFVTHMHGDHCYGLPGILTSRGLMSGSEGKVTIYGPKGIQKFIETILKLSYTKLKYKIDFVEFMEGGVVYEDDNETITSVKLSHDVPSFGYVLEEKDRVGSFDVVKAKELGIKPGPVFGKLSRGERITLEDGSVIDGQDFIGPAKKGRKVVIGGDNDSPGLFSEKLQDADLFVHEATHTIEVQENLTWSARHSTAASVAKTASEKSVSNLILTHVSPRFSLRVDESDANSVSVLRKEAADNYDGELYLAQDFDCFALSRDGELTLEKRKVFKKRK